MMKQRKECPTCGHKLENEFSLIGQVVAYSLAVLVLLWIMVGVVFAFRELARLL